MLGPRHTKVEFSESFLIFPLNKYMECQTCFILGWKPERNPTTVGSTRKCERTSLKRPWEANSWLSPWSQQELNSTWRSFYFSFCRGFMYLTSCLLLPLVSFVPDVPWLCLAAAWAVPIGLWVFWSLLDHIVRQHTDLTVWYFPLQFSTSESEAKHGGCNIRPTSLRRQTLEGQTMGQPWNVWSAWPYLESGECLSR